VTDIQVGQRDAFEIGIMLKGEGHRSTAEAFDGMSTAQRISLLKTCLKWAGLRLTGRDSVRAGSRLIREIRLGRLVPDLPRSGQGFREKVKQWVWSTYPAGHAAFVADWAHEPLVNDRPSDGERYSFKSDNPAIREAVDAYYEAEHLRIPTHDDIAREINDHKKQLHADHPAKKENITGDNVRRWEASGAERERIRSGLVLLLESYFDTEFERLMSKCRTDADLVREKTMRAEMKKPKVKANA
jgi:hypothetical protein